MNIEDQIVKAFAYEVEQNHHHLVSKDLFNKSPESVLLLVFEQVSRAKEKGYSTGHIEFNAPHIAFGNMVRKHPITYMDKLIILAAFARCIHFFCELTAVEVKGRLVTYIIVHKMDDPSISYTLCPGVPFNKTPHYVKN
jgi:hypothetical protein